MKARRTTRWRAPLPGGLAFSTVVSLLFLPTIYAMLDDMRSGSGKLVRRALLSRQQRRDLAPMLVERSLLRVQWSMRQRSKRRSDMLDRSRSARYSNFCRMRAPASHTPIALPMLVRMNTSTTRLTRFRYQPRRVWVSSRKCKEIRVSRLAQVHFDQCAEHAWRHAGTEMASTVRKSQRRGC